MLALLMEVLRSGQVLDCVLKVEPKEFFWSDMNVGYEKEMNQICALK